MHRDVERVEWSRVAGLRLLSIPGQRVAKADVRSYGGLSSRASLELGLRNWYLSDVIFCDSSDSAVQEVHIFFVSCMSTTRECTTVSSLQLHLVGCVLLCVPPRSAGKLAIS